MRANSGANAIALAVLTTALAALPHPLAGASTAPHPLAGARANEPGSTAPLRAKAPRRCADARGARAGGHGKGCDVHIVLRSNGRIWRLDINPADVRQGYATWSKSPYALM